MIIIHIGLKHGIQLFVGLFDFRLISFKLNINLINFFAHCVILGQYLIQLFSEISEKLSEKSRIILNFINVKLIHDLCQRFKHLACLIKLRHIHAVEDHIRCLGNLLCCFRTKRYNGIHIVNFDRADNIVHFF